MRLDLTVTHVPDIKSKKPWPRLTWLGNQVNDLLLVDSHRIKVLCQSGKNTNKKKIVKLQSHLTHLVSSCVSPNGAYLLCLLESGNLLIYNKDKDSLKTVPGIDQIVTHKTIKAADKTSTGTSAPLVFMSSDASYILVVIGQRQLYMWEINQSQLLPSAKQHILNGTWSRIDCEGATLPSVDCKETSIKATFFQDSVLGSCCICSFVFNHRSNIQISSVFLHCLEPYHVYTTNQSHFNAKWSTLSYPLSDLSESCEPVRHHGAYLISHSHSGQTLAIAVNQRSPADTCVLFMSTMGSVAVSVDMKGCGCRKDNIRTNKIRSYWLADIAWTVDDLFLACLTKQGCLALLSRLGEPVLIQSYGCSTELQPGYFLPFHPLVTFIPSSKQRSSSFMSSNQESLSPSSSLRSEADEKRQRYSLATHHSLPILLISDGYLVTVMELPTGLSCTGIVREFLSEGRTAVNLLLEKQGIKGNRLRGLSTLQTSISSGKPGLDRGLSKRTLSLDEVRTDSLDKDGLMSTAGSDFADYADRFSQMEEGQFVFSDSTQLQNTQLANLSNADGQAVITDRAQRSLMSAWGLVVSHTGQWTNETEDLIQYTARSLINLFVVLKASHHQRTVQDLSTVYMVLNLFKAATTTLYWDSQSHHSLPTALKLISGTVKSLLRHSGYTHLTTAPRWCISILQYSEKLLTNIYSFTKSHQPTVSYRLLPYHKADIVESSLMCQDSVRMRGSLDSGMTRLPRGSSEWKTNQQEVDCVVIPVRHTPAKRLIKAWKLLHRHLAVRYRKLHRDSSTHQRRGVRKLLLLICGVQLKLKQLGCNVALSVSQEWSKRIDASFLKGCEYYLRGHTQEAITCWYMVLHHTKQLQYGDVMLPSNQDHPTQDYTTQIYKSPFPTTGSSTLVSHSLLAILYTHLEQYNLVSAIRLVDSLIECYNIEQPREDKQGKQREGGRQYHVIQRSKVSFLGWNAEEKQTHPELPCVPDLVQREAVQTLARFMALYFTNHFLFVYPPCAAKPLPPLHLPTTHDDSCRMVPIYHDRISQSVRQQQLSDIWTADTAMGLLLVCGLLPEAVWLVRELRDWKSALMLSVIARENMNAELDNMKTYDASMSEILSLPERLTPLVIVKEGISVILQTPLTSPTVGGGRPIKRNSSFNEQDRRGSNSLIVSGLRRSSSMCSVNEEDRVLQEQLSRSLTDMLSAATIADLDPTPWLLSNLMDRCLSMVAEFNTLVPEEFYLPAPPFYCPQPDYEPKDSDPEEVLYESSLRHEVNDVIQLLLLVLNSAKCSLPCARWYVQQLDMLATVEARKKKQLQVSLPSVLIDHAHYPVDLLKTGIDSANLPHCTVKLLQIFRDLCTLVWMLHARDKLTMAVRRYQACRERTLRVKPQNNAESAKHNELLQDILNWADNLHPFSSFLNLEEEVQDILLTAISELPPTKKTVATLARHFHDAGTLAPMLEEKFQRLMEKLKRKSELSTRKTKKKVGESEKENKRLVKYETLHQHYRYECKQRKLAVSNRHEVIGGCEVQVFTEVANQHSSKQSTDDIPQHSESASTAKQQQQQEQCESDAGFTQEGECYPLVGSREFESSTGYLDFLETFFLVAFGKIVQESAPFTGKAKLPLLKVYSSELRQKEFGSVVKRMSGNAKPTTVEIDSSSIARVQLSNKDPSQPNPYEKPEKLSADDETKSIKSRSMFHHKQDTTEGNADVISLSRHGSRSSLLAFADSNKMKTSLSKSKIETSSRYSILQPYSTVVLNLGRVYKSQAQLLQWFGRWSERQLAIHAHTSGQIDNESKAVIRVRIPQQLVLNSLWLVRHIYNVDLFEVQSIPESPVSVMNSHDDHGAIDQYPKEADKAASSSYVSREKRRNDTVDKDEGIKVDNQRKSKTKRTSRKKKQRDNNESEEDKSYEESRNSERTERRRGNKKEDRRKKANRKIRLTDEKVRQEESSGNKVRQKRRQLPEVTQSPRDSPSHTKTINQLLLRTKSPSSLKVPKQSSGFGSVSDLSDGSSISVTIETSQGIIELSQGSDEEKRPSLQTVRKPGKKRYQRHRRSRQSVTGRNYIDSDSSSSSLDISSLDEADLTSSHYGKQRATADWLVNTEKQMTEAQYTKIASEEQQPLTDTSVSLNLNMKDADVKRLVREEFMRIMMEKSKTSPQPGNIGSTIKPKHGDQEKPIRTIMLVQDSTTQSGTSHDAFIMQGKDAETQAPSPVLQSWHGVKQSSSHKDITPLTVTSATKDVNRNDLKPIASGKYKPADSGHDQLQPVQCSNEASVLHSDFKPDLHSTAYDADSKLVQSLSGRIADDKQDTGTRRRVSCETAMDELRVEDLDDMVDQVNNGPDTFQHGHSTHPNYGYGNNGNTSERLPPPTYKSTFRFAMQIPMLLTVPPEKLAHGALRAAFNTPHQGTAQSHHNAPSDSRPIAPNMTPVDSNVHASHYQQSYRAPPDYFSQQRTESKAPSESVRNAPTHPLADSRYDPAVNFAAREQPVRHLVSLLHPGAQQHQEQYSSDTLPSIPLLHMEPRYTVPSMPTPRYPNLANIFPSHPVHPSSNTENPLPLLQLQPGGKSSQFVPLEELNAFERRQRQDGEKHPAVKARQMYEGMEERPGPLQLLHVDLKNDLNNVTRQRRRQVQDTQKVPGDIQSSIIADQTADQSKKTREGPKPNNQQLRQQHLDDRSENRPLISGEKIEKERKDQIGSDENKMTRDTKSGTGGKMMKSRVILVEQQSSEGQLPSESEAVSSNTDSEKEDAEKDKNMRQENTGTAYAIKPGSFDSVLHDHDAKSAIPTAAQVHYDTIRQLQSKPTATSHTRNVSTSMSKDDFPHHTPSVTEATSQYTVAATGLADNGQVVAPDIFFNLRFGSSVTDQQPSLQDKEISKGSSVANKGRSFISVVDIELKDIPDIPLDVPRLQTDQLTQPSQPPTLTQSTPPPSPTNAELHYNALFLKDAHPKKTPPKVQFEETEGGPDEVTLRVLEKRAKADSRQLAKSRAQSESTRLSTKASISQRLAQMDQQLNAIEESAANIDQDFRNTSLMLHTVENLAEVMAPGDTRPKADYTFRDYKEPTSDADHSGHDSKEPIVDDDDLKRSQELRLTGEQKEDVGDVTMVTESEDNLTGVDRGDDTRLTLGLSGISGVSDIIAEVIADGSSEIRMMGISTQQQKAAKNKLKKRREAEQGQVDDFGHLSSDKIKELLETPRTPRQDEEEKWPSRRKATERSEEERRELHEWATRKRAKNLEEYKKQRGEKMGSEHKPYQSNNASGPSSLKEIRKLEETRDKNRRVMREETHGERVQLAKALMSEIFTDKPKLPKETSPKTTRKRDRTLQEFSTDPLQSSKMSTRQDKSGQRGTYMFIDSGTYQNTPTSIKENEGRTDKRSFGYNPRKQEDLTRGTKLQGQDYTGHGVVSRESDDWMMLDGISEITETSVQESRNKTSEMRLYKPKPYDQVVRVQRPEVTRKQQASPRKQKTYTEALQEMKGEGYKKKSSTQTLKAKQRLYGTTRLPGSGKAPDRTSPRVTRTYSQRLCDMQQKTGGQTRLRQRSRPVVPKINTDTMTFNDRRRQVEGRGIHAEATPRSSTPYHEQLTTRSFSGTYRARDDVVSPAPKVGVKYKPKGVQPTTYVERLQRASLEAPRTHRHKDAYVGVNPRETYKSPPLRIPTSRHQPYPKQGQSSSVVDEWDERSGLSDISSWNVSDEVKNILERRDSYEGNVEYGTDDDVSLEGLDYNDYTASVDIKQLQDIASVSSGSVMSNIDWGAVDRMIADVH